MDHSEWKQKIFDFYDGELPANEAAAVKNHLKECVECNNELEHWRRISGVFFKPVPSGPVEAFVTRVMARLEERPSERSFGAWFLGWKGPALALGFSTFLLIGTLPRENTASALSELLLINGSDAVTTFLFEPDPGAGEVLTMALKEAQ